ncbi:MAG: glycoside hydrolase family 3 N-terminal domain-containing protein [Bacteroidota bacterium]
MRTHSLLPLTLLLFLFTSCSEPQETSEQQAEEPILTDQMLGQLIMIGFRGLEMDSVSDVIKGQIASGEIGNIILFDYDLGFKRRGRNIASPEQVQRLLADMQAIAPGYLLTAIDQEGGLVTRLRSAYGFPDLPSAQYLGGNPNTDSTSHYATLNAQNLQALGLNVNFAPVVDLNVNPENPVIGGIERSFGEETSTVVAHARAWIAPHEDAGVLSVLKHFPGHGSSESDSHKGFTDVTQTWTPEELAPYRELLASEQAIGVMTAHVFNRSIDSIYPATMSPHYIQGILRDSFHYDGVVFSDDLQMKAVNTLYPFETIIEQTIKAGVDILVFGNNIKEYDETLAQKTIATIRKLLKEGKLTEERLQTSYQRVMALKQRLQQE